MVDSGSKFFLSFFTPYKTFNPYCSYHVVLLTGDGHSIYIKNLPLNVSATQLEGEFKKFGPIKQGGVQVRSNKVYF